MVCQVDLVMLVRGGQLVLLVLLEIWAVMVPKAKEESKAKKVNMASKASKVKKVTKASKVK